jgi:hypothetical protein
MNKFEDTVVLDRRVTKAYEWLAGIFASLLVIILVWVGSTLVEVRQAQAVAAAQAVGAVVRIDRIEAKVERVQERVEAVDARMTGIEARQIRQIGQ